MTAEGDDWYVATFTVDALGNVPFGFASFIPSQYYEWAGAKNCYSGADCGGDQFLVSNVFKFGTLDYNEVWIIPSKTAPARVQDFPVKSKVVYLFNPWPTTVPS